MHVCSCMCAHAHEHACTAMYVAPDLTPREGHHSGVRSAVVVASPRPPSAMGGCMDGVRGLRVPEEGVMLWPGKQVQGRWIVHSA